MSVISMFPGGSGNLRIAAGKTGVCLYLKEQVISGIAFKPRFIAVSMHINNANTSGHETTLYYVSKDGTGKIHNFGTSDPESTMIQNNAIEMTDDGFRFTPINTVHVCWTAIG